MYVPAHFAMTDAQTARLLAGIDAADLVTCTESGPVATFLPVLFDPGVGERGAFLAHLARNNPQWRGPWTGEAMLLARAGDHYVSPSAYASKAEHGRVVPTWNYTTAHIYGQLVVHDDPQWCGQLVTALTRRHESRRERPWEVSDAPERFVAGQLRAIVGVELRITHVEAKAKLSQNRPAADVEGVVADLRARGEHAAAEAVRAAGEIQAHDEGRSSS